MNEDEEIEDCEDEDDQPTECYFCGYETTKLNKSTHTESYRDNKSTEVAYFCDICYSTHASNAFWYSSQYPNSYILRSISYIGNKILDALSCLPKE